MMNKSKIDKAWRWKVATFLPLLVLLLLACGNRDGKISKNLISSEKQLKQQIDIRKDGNYIDNKLCSVTEIVRKGWAWNKRGNKKVHLQIEDSVPYSRIDEVRQALENGRVRFVTQTTGNTNDTVYSKKDQVSYNYNQSFYDYMKRLRASLRSQEHRSLEYKIQYSFIIGRDGKIRDAHVMERFAYPVQLEAALNQLPEASSDIKATYEKFLAQLPELDPPLKGNENVSLYITRAVWREKR
jgi:hypothetical protein